MKHSKLIFATLLAATGSLLAADTTLVGIPILGESPASQTATDVYNNSGTTGPIQVRVDDTKPGISIKTGGLFGADLPVWNSPSTYAALKPYLVDAGFNWFRFPNGSLSNEYHWNGSGKYDETGIWTPSKTQWTPGFVSETKWRGTSKDNYGFRRPSNLTDGDTSTVWWGAVYDPMDPPWFVVDLGKPYEVDSVKINWGSVRPKAFKLVAWDSAEAAYPGPHQLHTNLWKLAFASKVESANSESKIPHKTSRYWAVQFSARDLSSEGVQVKEFSLFSASRSVTVLPKTWGMSTRAGDMARTDWTNIKWQFESFMEYVQSIPNGRPVLCVNLATGSPEEAALWVRYANSVKGYQVKDWQLGNENDGDWEEAGPLSARQYAARFLAFSKAMKAVDPTIKIHGPLHSSDEFLKKGDGLFTGRSWMESFLKIVGEAEAKDGKRWLDAVDFHTYPYWSSTGVKPLGMLASSARPGPMMDTLSSWMAKYLKDGGQREVHMSEFSSTVVGSSQTLSAVQATTVAHLFAQFVTRFGDRGHALPWDTYGGWQKGPDDTQGSLRMANPTPPGSISSWDSYAPSSQYFGLQLAFQKWIRAGLKVLPTTTADSAVRAFSLGNGDTTRVLLINMTDRSLPVQVSRLSAVTTPWQVFVFGNENYDWKGTTDKAHPIPGMGPWANRMPASANAVIQLPALGMTLVSWDPKTPQSASLEAVHYAATATTLLAGDTFEFWGTFRQKEGSITGGTFRCPPFASGNIQFADKVPGGEMEGVHLRIPIPTNAKPGQYRFGLELAGAGNEGLAETVPFRVRGSYRTTLALADFDSTDPALDTYAHGSNSTSMTTVVKPGNPPLGKYLQSTFNIEQPKNQNWPNFVALHFPLNPTILEAKGVAGVVFDYSTQHSNDVGYFELFFLTDTVKDSDEYQIRLKNTHGNWARDTVLWSQMSQEGWGISTGPLYPKQIRKIEFRARVEGKGILNLDNIYLLSEDGAELRMSESLRRMR
jgi:hypothetical protein